MSTPAPALTPRQRDALAAIVAGEQRVRRGLTIRELTERLGLAPTSNFAVQRFIAGLRAAGLIEPDGAHGLLPTAQGIAANAGTLAKLAKEAGADTPAAMVAAKVPSFRAPRLPVAKPGGKIL